MPDPVTQPDGAATGQRESTPSATPAAHTPDEVRLNGPEAAPAHTPAAAPAHTPEAAPAHTPETAPARVVERFLKLLQAGEMDAACELLASDVEYVNVGLPTIWGRERVRRVLRATLGLKGAGFEVYFHTLSADGPHVLSERTDVMTYRRWRAQFWVCGRFDVRDGEIVLWRDYFDNVNFWLATARGMLGTVLPALRAKPPRSAPG